jgi:hypothetical protein
MTTAAQGTTPIDRQPLGRYEWERLVRRISMPGPIKLLALTLSTYADADGSRVRPGQGTLAAVIGRTERTIRRQMTILEDDLGLLQQVSRGGGRGGVGNPAVYRLTIPVDLLERVRLLSPSERPEVSPDIQVSGQSLESPDTQMSGQTGPSPVDNPDSPDIQMSPENDFHRTSDAVTELMTGHPWPIDRTSGCPTTTHIPTTKDQPTTPDPAQPQPARDEANPSQNDLGELAELRAAPTADRCGHGFAIRNRDDGQPTCAFCRRGTHPAKESA